MVMNVMCRHSPTHDHEARRVLHEQGVVSLLNQGPHQLNAAAGASQTPIQIGDLDGTFSMSC